MNDADQQSGDDRELGLAIEVFERCGPEALDHWLRRRGAAADTLASHFGPLIDAGLLQSSDPGDVPARFDRYRVLQRLGSGAMSVVFLGIDDELDRLVAIKVLSPAFAGNERLRERFRREARAIAHLRHPGIVPVLDAGETDGQLYTVLEYVAGTSLEEGLERLGEIANDPQHVEEAAVREAFRLPGAARIPASLPLLAAHWTKQISDALAEAHAAGIVHRDVKPSNVMVDDEGRARLLDFGLAHVTDDVRMTWSADVIGTPRYLAPEIVQHGVGRSDHRADLFALGACLYELLTLTPPFAAVSAAQVMQQILDLDPAPPSRANPAVSRDLDAVAQVALSKDPGRRYIDARAMADDLDRVLAGEPVRARAPSSVERLLAQARRRPLVATLTVMLLLVLFGTTAIVLGYNSRLLTRTQQAEIGRQSTESSLDFLERLLELSDVEELGPDVPARTLLAEGAARVKDAAQWEEAGLVRPRLARTLGALSWGAGDLDGASELLTLAHELLRVGPPAGIDPQDWTLERARAENYRGNVLRARGLRTEAEDAYREALAVASATWGAPGREQEATILANLADLLGELGELEEAEALARRALELCEGADEETLANRAWGLIALARLQVRGGKLEEANTSIEDARTVAAGMTDRPLQEAMVLDAGAMLALAMGDHARASELLSSEAALIERTIGPDATILAETLVSLGTTHRSAGDPDQARSVLERAILIFDAAEADAHPKRSRAFMALGFLCVEESDDRGALTHLTEVVSVWTKSGADVDALAELQTRMTLAAVEARLGQVERALATLAEAWDRVALADRENPAFLAERLLAIARIEFARDDAAEAEAAYEQALGHARAAGQGGTVAWFAEIELARLKENEKGRNGASALGDQER